jgi:hypothetical protein
MESIYKETIYEERWCKMTLNKSNKRLHQVWIGRTTVDNFKDVVDKTNEALKDNKIETCLADMTNKENGSPDEKYYALQVFPLMQRRGLKKMAIILPEIEYVHDLVKEFAAEFDRDIVSCFDNVREAEEWLNERAERRAA